MRGVAEAPEDERGSRWVMHLDMDAFFASVEQLTRPTLRGRPVLVGGLGGRGVVAGASYEARVFGARSAMPMHQARRLVGAGAVVLPPRVSVYRKASERTFSIVREVIPVIEMLSFDGGLRRAGRVGGGIGGRSHRVRREHPHPHRGRDGTDGVGGVRQRGNRSPRSPRAWPNPTACSRWPQCRTRLPARTSGPQTLGDRAGVGDKLTRLGVDTIGDFAAMSDIEVASVLGGTLGPALHRLAQGIDDRPVAERASAKQISAESTFPEDITTMPGLRTAISRVAADAHRRLLADGRGARTVVLKLKRTDMSILPDRPLSGRAPPTWTHSPRRHSDWRSTRWKSALSAHRREFLGSHRHRAVHAVRRHPRSQER